MPEYMFMSAGEVRVCIDAYIIPKYLNYPPPPLYLFDAHMHLNKLTPK